MPVELKEIESHNLNDVLRLKVAAHEIDFVAANSFSISQAYVEKNLYPKAIYADSILVGFIMYGKWLGADSYWITRLMISPEYRGRGYARKAVQIAISDLFSKPDCQKVSISFVPRNEPARALYISLGFKEAGLIENEIRFNLSRE